jgi:uroporphyrin-III C-methyltransferase
MGASNIAEIALNLMRAGLPGSLPVLAVAHVTTPREVRQRSRLDRIGVEMAERPLPAPVLFVIGHVVSLYQGSAVPMDLPLELPEVMAGE